VIRPENLRFSAMSLASGADRNEQKTPLEAIATQLDRLFLSPPPELHRQLEELIVKRALTFCADNQVQTAKLLGLSRNILRKQLKQFGLIGNDSIGSDVVSDTDTQDAALDRIDRSFV